MESREGSQEHLTFSAENLLYDENSDEINICISECTFKQVIEKYPVKNKCLKLCQKSKPMTQNEFLDSTRTLYKCCLTGVKDLHELHLRRTLGLKIINDIIKRAHPDFIKVPYVIHIIWSIMCCIHHFQLRLKLMSLRVIIWARKRKLDECLQTYSKLIDKINPSMHRVVLNSILTLYREGKLWEMEFACTHLIIKLLTLYDIAENGFEDIIFTIERISLTDQIQAKYLTQVLYSVLDKLRWDKMSIYLLTKFISMAESSISPKPTDLYMYAPLRNGLQNCLRNITVNLGVKDLILMIYIMIKRVNLVDDQEEEVITALGKAVVFAAKVYKKKAGRKPLAKGPFPLVFGLFDIKKPHIEILALRIWQHLIDRNDNLNIFVTPKIFFQGCNYKIKQKQCLQTDKIFFKKFRHLVVKVAFECFQKANSRMYLENVYHFIALTLVEIPCGYTASCFVTVAMALQEYAIRIMEKNLVRANHLHATVMAIMTLICHIHKANVFYDYVNTIMERRAELAPHLNPPLKSRYSYAQHHILWNKPELFFEDWETRYGLWHCFRRTKFKINEFDAGDEDKYDKIIK